MILIKTNKPITQWQERQIKEDIKDLLFMYSSKYDIEWMVYTK
jgi:hypothetical protein